MTVWSWPAEVVRVESERDALRAKLDEVRAQRDQLLGRCAALEKMNAALEEHVRELQGITYRNVGGTR